MNLSGRPLGDNVVDAELFVDRERELGELCHAIEHRLNALVVGEAGSGKTSLLRALMYRARNQALQLQPYPIGDYLWTYVRAAAVADPGELLARIVEEVTGTAPASGASDRDLLAMLDFARENQVQAVFDRWQAEGKQTDGASVTPVIVIDDVTATAGHGLFGRLRDELWNLGYTWLVAVRGADRGALLMPPADAFFERVVDVGPLLGPAAAQMITRRTGSAPSYWAEQVADAVGGNPRRILEIARDMTAGGGFEVVLDALRVRKEAIQRLGRPAMMLADAIEGLGAASASDEALLAQLGWTRARAVQVLGELEHAGLVVSEDVRIGQGRPRKVYRLVPALDYLEHHRDGGSVAS